MTALDALPSWLGVCRENGSTRRRDVVPDLIPAELGRSKEAFLFERLVVTIVTAMPDDLHATEQGQFVQ